jgi:hypothetical protein
MSQTRFQGTQKTTEMGRVGGEFMAQLPELR